METLKNGYVYFYYYTCRLIKKNSNIVVGMRAHMVLGTIWGFLLPSLLLQYYMVFKSMPAGFKTYWFFWFFGPYAIISVFDLWFLTEKRTKQYSLKFDAWPENKKKKWDLIMRYTYIIIICYIIFTLYSASR